MRTSDAKVLAALALTGFGSALVVGFRVPPTTAGTTDAATTGSATAGAATAAGAASTTASANVTQGGTGAGASASSGGSTATATYKDGTYTGAAVGEPWGTFQVQAVISGGKLTNVTVVSEPSDGHSSRINSRAVPMLTQSAVAAQSASIDAVSGATWTSQSYVTSLQAALDQAKTAAVTVG